MTSASCIIARATPRMRCSRAGRLPGSAARKSGDAVGLHAEPPEQLEHLALAALRARVAMIPEGQQDVLPGLEVAHEAAAGPDEAEAGQQRERLRPRSAARQVARRRGAPSPDSGRTVPTSSRRKRVQVGSRRRAAAGSARRAEREGGLAEAAGRHRAQLDHDGEDHRQQHVRDDHEREALHDRPGRHLGDLGDRGADPQPVVAGRRGDDEAEEQALEQRDADVAAPRAPRRSLRSCARNGSCTISEEKARPPAMVAASNQTVSATRLDRHADDARHDQVAQRRRCRAPRSTSISRLTRIAASSAATALTAAADDDDRGEQRPELADHRPDQDLAAEGGVLADQARDLGQHDDADQRADAGRCAPSAWRPGEVDLPVEDRPHRRRGAGRRRCAARAPSSANIPAVCSSWPRTPRPTARRKRSHRAAMQ